jgi:hypothetical protein
LAQVITGDPLLGGDDVISTGEGRDLALGGWANDTINGGGDNDVLFGDAGVVTFIAGALSHFMSIDVLMGGNDILIGGGGLDVMIGGYGLDSFEASLSEDLVFGAVAGVQLDNWIVKSIESDLNDFNTSTLFSGFNAVQSGGINDPEESNTQILIEKPAGGSEQPVALPERVIGQAIPLLSATVFQKLFNSQVITLPQSPTRSPAESASEAGPAAQDGQSIQEPGQPIIEGTGDQQGAPQGQVPEPGGLDPLAQAFGSGTLEFSETNPAHAVFSTHSAMSKVDHQVPQGADENAAALALAGLAASSGTAKASRVAQSGRGLLDRDAMTGSRKPTSLGRRALEAVTRKWFGAGDAMLSPVEQREVEPSVKDAGKPASTNAKGNGRIRW